MALGRACTGVDCVGVEPRAEDEDEKQPDPKVNDCDGVTAGLLLRLTLGHPKMVLLLSCFRLGRFDAIRLLLYVAGISRAYAQLYYACRGACDHHDIY